MKLGREQADSLNESLMPSSSSSSFVNPVRRLFEFDFFPKRRTLTGSINDSSALNESSLLDSTVFREELPVEYLPVEDDEIDRDSHETAIE